MSEKWAILVVYNHLAFKKKKMKNRPVLYGLLLAGSLFGYFFWKNNKKNEESIEDIKDDANSVKGDFPTGGVKPIRSIATEPNLDFPTGGVTMPVAEPNIKVKAVAEPDIDLPTGGIRLPILGTALAEPNVDFPTGGFSGWSFPPETLFNTNYPLSLLQPSVEMPKRKYSGESVIVDPFQ